MPRKHKIDNARTRRHMYRHANELLYYTYSLDRDFLLNISRDDIEVMMKEALDAKAEEMLNTLEHRMRYKYPRETNPIIEVRKWQDYNIDYNTVRFVAEVRRKPSMRRDDKKV